MEIGMGTMKMLTVSAEVYAIFRILIAIETYKHYTICTIRYDSRTDASSSFQFERYSMVTDISLNMLDKAMDANLIFVSMVMLVM